MSVLPRRLSRRGPGRVSYDPSDPLPPEPASDAEREAALDAHWKVLDQLEKQAAGDCEPSDAEWAEAAFAMAQECWGDYDADERGLMSEERENVVRGDA